MKTLGELGGEAGDQIGLPDHEHRGRKVRTSIAILRFSRG